MKFWIGAASCSLRLPFAGSLKERRHVVRSIIDGVRSRFSVSAADLGPLDLWQSVELGFTAAGSSSAEVSERLENLENFLRIRHFKVTHEKIDGGSRRRFKTITLCRLHNFSV